MDNPLVMNQTSGIPPGRNMTAKTDPGELSEQDMTDCQNFLKIMWGAYQSSQQRKTDRLKTVVSEDSEMYRQQRNRALNYHKRGIREKAKSIEASAVRVSGEYEIQIDSKEAIKVSYG